PFRAQFPGLCFAWRVLGDVLVAATATTRGRRSRGWLAGLAIRHINAAVVDRLVHQSQASTPCAIALTVRFDRTVVVIPFDLVLVMAKSSGDFPVFVQGDLVVGVHGPVRHLGTALNVALGFGPRTAVMS